MRHKCPKESVCLWFALEKYSSNVGGSAVFQPKRILAMKVIPTEPSHATVDIKLRFTIVSDFEQSLGNWDGIIRRDSIVRLMRYLNVDHCASPTQILDYA